MDDSAMPILSPVSDTSIHYEHVKKALPAWLLNTSATRLKELKAVKPTLPDWHRNASTAAHQSLKNATQLAWTAQNDVDQVLSNLQDVRTFAKPILQQALKDRFGMDDDVEDTWLRLYSPAKTSWWVHDFSAGTTSRTVSLLDAALHNFSRDEAFSPDSEFITRPDARGHFGVKHLEHKLSIDQFKSLCRELDIGARYQRHLNEFLLSSNPVANSVVRQKVILSQQHALSVAAHMCLMKKDIDQDAFNVVQGMVENRAELRWNGERVVYYNLGMLEVTLSGIIVIATARPAGTEFDTFANVVSDPLFTRGTHGISGPLIVYVPHDPEHPLKLYPSSLEFMAELTGQLRDTSAVANYQQFFSEFVAHQQRGHFFAKLNDRLNKVKWQPAAPGSNLPSWRETPVEKPDLQFSLSNIQDDRNTRFTGDLWTYIYQQKLNKVLNDAREIAISTEYADRMARWAWWDNLEKMLSDMLNIALFVATPLVPGLGELMLAYTAYQLTDEVVEGIVDLAEGRFAEAAEQVIGVVESVIQLGAFAAGGAIGNIARAKLSPFFEGLKPVQLSNGQTRLWNPDLTPYQRSELVLPTDAKPDHRGIYQHQDQQIVRLDDQHFEVKEESTAGQHRIQHPERADAYAPILKHNDHGAWVSETENPREWEGSTLMRRLGHATEEFSDTELQQIRQISGIEDDVLRRMHVEHTAPPPLLIDTLQRLGASGSSEALSPDMALLFSDTPELPENVAQKILTNATKLENEQIARTERLPLRLKAQARELQFETQSVRAAQGLFQDALSNIATERLALGALRMHTDTFGDLRVEIRESTFDGELRCSAGPDDATTVRVMIRNDAGKYEVRDAANQPVHEADDFLEAMLHATGKEGQQALGYKPGQGEFLRQWLIAKCAPPAERRTMLATPPIRAVAEPETMLLLRGGGLSREGLTLHERIQDLHPDFSENEINTFAEALTERGEPLKAIEQHENDLQELKEILNRWKYQQELHWGPDSRNFSNDHGEHIAEQLIECFERKKADLGNRADPDSYSLDLSIFMLYIDLEPWWSKRPPLKKFFDRITVLKLDYTRFSTESNGLLKDFPNLRELSAMNCSLARLPESIGSMHKLERLRLSNNRIALDAPAVEQLKNLTYLEILRLEDNPLGLPPNISRMPRLKVVDLHNTGLTTWPLGTLAKPRPRGFHMDLRGNPIEVIPEVVLASDQARVVARTRLDVSNLSDLNQVLYQEIRESLALPPEPAVPLDSEVDDLFGTAIGTRHWNDVPGWGVDRANLWSSLIDEPQAERFMSELVDAEEFADYRAGGKAREQLRQRIWRMLDAVQIDTRLREKLFTMAAAPVDCSDAGAQLFNNMGINVLASEAYSFSTDPAQLQKKLVTLAKGAARLDLVNEIARADMQSRGGNPDEVEVYLAYQTGLADRLGLPWQSEGMLYRGVSGVTDAMIDNAYDTVLDLEEGDGLVNQMLEQDFWQDYLRETWPVRMESNKQLYLNKYEQLETLRETQRAWSESEQLTETQRTELRTRLTSQMEGLPVTQSEVFVDEPISDSVFDRWLVELGEGEKQLARSLTQTALAKAAR
jgi:hypothetical protein